MAQITLAEYACGLALLHCETPFGRELIVPHYVSVLAQAHHAISQWRTDKFNGDPVTAIKIGTPDGISLLILGISVVLAVFTIQGSTELDHDLLITDGAAID